MITTILQLKVLELFQNYGLVFTILILAIFIAYLIIKNSTKRIREQEHKIDTLYERIDGLLNKFKTDDHGNNLVDKFTDYADKSNIIQIQLYHVLQNFDADRVTIFEYHNGGKNLAGIEFKKCSNTYEAVSLETKPMIREMQNLPLSISPLWNKILANRKDIIIPNVSALTDEFFKSYLVSQNIHAYYSMILEDYDNTPIGFITIEYYKSPKVLTEKEWKEFVEIATKASVLIKN